MVDCRYSVRKPDLELAEKDEMPMYQVAIMSQLVIVPSPGSSSSASTSAEKMLVPSPLLHWKDRVSGLFCQGTRAELSGPRTLRMFLKECTFIMSIVLGQ